MQDAFKTNVDGLIGAHVFARPERVTDVPSWQSHIPFAFFLIGALKPAALVELGTHKADSYSAFCQAVKSLRLPTRCFAVDTWQGDEHAGNYDDAIYKEVSSYNQEHFAAFSTLVRARFEDAVTQFADGSIDLLHIDGLHTYEAVRNDFETWRSKLSKRAVVLFHDTQVREGDFGVWKYWAELSAEYPTQEFRHGHGLGVLAYGAEMAEGMKSFFDADESAWSDIELFFERLGLACSGRGTELMLNGAIARLQQEYDHLFDVVTQQTAAMTKQNAEIGDFIALRGRLWDEARGAAAEADLLRQEIDAVRKRNSRLEVLTESLSWRITLPLRVARRGEQRLRGLAKSRLGQLRTALANRSSRRIGSFTVPESPDPAVSVIIATYGNLDMTLDCLRSIVRTAPASAIEVLVVDDAYPKKEEMGRLGQIPGVRFIRNETNLGFLRTCNHAASLARGRYIYLLNNDTLLAPDAIDALVRLLDARPDIGMAGSKLVYPNGKLQEAGGIIWSDASGWNYGRGEDPNLPQFNYLREVDYCSGASLMIRRDLFTELGGFDEYFLPAYYEDVDLAFRVRQKGLKVFYEPRSVVAHLEGMSHGTDTASGGKAHQVVNRERMRERWAEVLDRDHFKHSRLLQRARDHGRRRKAILVIDHYTPEPDRDAGSRSVMGIMESLVDAGWSVKFWPHNRSHDPFYASALEHAGIEVLDGRCPHDFDSWMRSNGPHLDHVMAVRPEIAADVIPQLMRRTTAVRSYYGVDLHYMRMRMQASQSGDNQLAADADLMEHLERSVWRNFDVVIYPSEEEAVTVRKAAPQVLARGIVPFYFAPSSPRSAAPKERDLLFVAGFAHTPNVDAAQFLVTEIVPRLEQLVGPIKVTLAGSNPTEAVKALRGERVEVTGYISDERLAELYDSHRAAVVPLRFGAGVKGKVIEALSRGLPLVTTSVGAQGIIGLEQVVTVCDSATDLAAALSVLMSDDEAWLARSHGQMAFAQQFYSRAAMRASVVASLEAAEAAKAG
ncbi:class I SAM-dependent methyltransferase [Bosea sp. UNC402CLCol]|uniref:class I SAM-dependent methyltransferase n=1 Tax=Bosea sp. UNC402CLCol TaxID=1510531 RepID=UPI00069131C9|nr:class I SAM-dependent methyltransferase [Bosea sp. UNC402CLCol]